MERNIKSAVKITKTQQYTFIRKKLIILKLDKSFDLSDNNSLNDIFEDDDWLNFDDEKITQDKKPLNEPNVPVNLNQNINSKLKNTQDSHIKDSLTKKSIIEPKLNKNFEFENKKIKEINQAPSNSVLKNDDFLSNEYNFVDNNNTVNHEIKFNVDDDEFFQSTLNALNKDKPKNNDNFKITKNEPHTLQKSTIKSKPVKNIDDDDELNAILGIGSLTKASQKIEKINDYNFEIDKKEQKGVIVNDQLDGKKSNQNLSETSVSEIIKFSQQNFDEQRDILNDLSRKRIEFIESIYREQESIHIDTIEKLKNLIQNKNQEIINLNESKKLINENLENYFNKEKSDKIIQIRQEFSQEIELIKDFYSKKIECLTLTENNDLTLVSASNCLEKNTNMLEQLYNIISQKSENLTIEEKKQVESRDKIFKLYENNFEKLSETFKKEKSEWTENMNNLKQELTKTIILMNEEKFKCQQKQSNFEMDLENLDNKKKQMDNEFVKQCEFLSNEKNKILVLQKDNFQNLNAEKIKFDEYKMEFETKQRISINESQKLHELSNQKHAEVEGLLKSLYKEKESLIQRESHISFEKNRLEIKQSMVSQNIQKLKIEQELHSRKVAEIEKKCIDLENMSIEITNLKQRNVDCSAENKNKQNELKLLENQLKKWESQLISKENLLNEKYCNIEKRESCLNSDIKNSICINCHRPNNENVIAPRFFEKSQSFEKNISYTIDTFDQIIQLKNDIDSKNNEYHDTNKEDIFLKSLH
ncbi:hypothetical protein A3Q56_01313 [Intoshia linei]|uniref:Fas-binding factor 1 n=1 Tax=Intoshia linei TaxID=1819745 RepID=A0A177B9M6_9BILA|nr:hypothetical protein A3Q56_01313 [Intoshia linei]